MKKWIVLFPVVVSFLLIFDAYADTNIAKNKIVFGQTAALDGPVFALGHGMRNGILAAFKEINDDGGVRGRSLELISYDDGYEPDQAIKNTKKLIEEDKVFALVGGVGTPTANAIEPITSKAGVPFIGPFTGAEFLRDPFKRYVVNIRASYWQETEAWIEYLTGDLGIKRIGILYQDDSYGRAGFSGVVKALDKRGLSLVGEGTYKRNTTAIKVALLNLRKKKPDAVVMVGAYQPCAEFIKLARKLDFTPKFVNISFVGSKALAKELGEQSEGIVVSQVVPFPFDRESSKLVAKYQSAINSISPDRSYDFVSLEGYMVGRFVVEVLKEIDGDITREAFLNKIYQLKNVSLDDVVLQFGEQDNQGMDEVFLTIMQKDQTFVPIGN